MLSYFLIVHTLHSYEFNFIKSEVDIFFTGQLQKLKVEPVLLHYFSHIKVLQGNIINHFLGFDPYEHDNNMC